MVFLDANTVIYLIEQPPILGSKARARLAALLALGERLSVSDLVRMGCQGGPLKANAPGSWPITPDSSDRPILSVLPLSAAVCDRAARIRAQHGFKPLDSLHLAAAAEHGCSRFLTSDVPLKRFPDLLVEVLS